jgi:2-polyprenyl-3-methyl-5-hydroxy-6-metoxy-1,4-benzoquinol methylase
VYWASFGELLNLNFSGENFARVRSHLDTWNGWNDLYRIIAFFIVLWVAFRRRTSLPLRGLALAAISMQVLLFFYHPSGRYTYLAWLLVLIILFIAIREHLLPWARENHPSRLAALGALPGIRHLGALTGSPRWRLAHQLAEITPRMSLLEGFKVECRPLVSPLGNVVSRLPRGGSLFDIGCGSGSLLHLALLNAGVAKAAGYDVAAKAVETARSLPWREDRLTVTRRAPAEGVPDLSHADAVTMCDVLHHIPQPGQAGAITELAGKMRPGATFILADIDAGRKVGRWLNQLHDLVVSREWAMPATAAHARAMVEGAGLTIVEMLHVRSLWYPHYMIVATKPPLNSGA